MNPRRLKGTPANIARYYTVGDYYTKGADEHSAWGGQIAAELGLSGKVDPAIFKDFLAGKISGQQLGRHRAHDEIEHHPGWDFAISAPKSVSILALVRGDERIIAAHERAVTAALDYLEEHAALRRRDEGEIVQETTGRLIYARFTEHASRELDPHLHTHIVTMNITNREDEASMASLETRAMFAEQMVAGQVYRNELAHDLREQGFGIDFDPRKGVFEISDVPHTLVQAMSQRAEQINAHARDHGLTGQAARQHSFYQTRRAKEKIGLEELHSRWVARSAPYVKALDEIRTKADAVGERALEPAAGVAARAMLFGIRQAETREAVNNLGRMLRIGLASDVGEVRLADLRPLVEEHERRLKLIATRAKTGDQIHTRGRTTRQTARLEVALSHHLSLALTDGRPIASAEHAIGAAQEAGLNPAQLRALLHAAGSEDRITGIHGVAGAGKSMLIKALVDAAEPGRSFVALAPTSSAAANLGRTASIESRTVASLLAAGGRDVTDTHILVLDEAGQLGSRQAQRVLEISRMTGARLILLGDNRQTGAIEQGKAFWLLQRLGLPTAELTESVRQETRATKAAVVLARAGDYAASLSSLDKVVSGADAETLAKGLVAEWTRLKPVNRANTNILVLDNATRLIVNTQIREVLQREGVIAAQDSRLAILSSSGMTDQEKHNARFYSGGQVVTFARDIGGSGIARDTEYRVAGIGRAANGRQVVRLVDENGREIRWDPRSAKPAHINVFHREERALSDGDRIQWRLASDRLGLKNAERGTVEHIEGSRATIRWDQGERVQSIDLAEHKNWDHGYAETVYSAQSRTYARVYVLAPVNSGLVNGQNYYTAITRARFGVKLWTEDEQRLADKLARNSGEKTSALEGLNRLDRDGRQARDDRLGARLDPSRDAMLRDRQEHRDRQAVRRAEREARDHGKAPRGLADHLAWRAQSLAESIERVLGHIAGRSGEDSGNRTEEQAPEPAPGRARAPEPAPQQAPSHGPER